MSAVLQKEQVIKPACYSTLPAFIVLRFRTATVYWL